MRDIKRGYHDGRRLWKIATDFRRCENTTLSMVLVVPDYEHAKASRLATRRGDFVGPLSGRSAGCKLFGDQRDHRNYARAPPHDSAGRTRIYSL
jgi:hypothetical protein